MPDAAITKEPRYADAIKRWQAFWALEDIGRPLWLVPTSPVLTAAVTRMAPMPQLSITKGAPCEGPQSSRASSSV